MANLNDVKLEQVEVKSKLRMDKTEIIQPIQSKKRIDLLDIYRRVAILGIFVVNIVVMNSTFLNYFL